MLSYIVVSFTTSQGKSYGTSSYSGDLSHHSVRGNRILFFHRIQHVGQVFLYARLATVSGDADLRPGCFGHSPGFQEVTSVSKGPRAVISACGPFDFLQKE
jgi:hypothetical protein